VHAKLGVDGRQVIADGALAEVHVGGDGGDALAVEQGERVGRGAVLLDELPDGEVVVLGQRVEALITSSRMSAASLSVLGRGWETGMRPR
jgi:hypothetical protein